MDLFLPISVVNSSEFSGAEPVDRATFICLLAYCCHMENNGRIIECNSWGDRRWQQTCKVTHNEVRRECELWAWDDFDLVVEFYPKEKQIIHQRLSAKGKEAALTRWERDRGLGSAGVEKSTPAPVAMPAVMPQARKPDASGNAVLEEGDGIRGIKVSRVRPAQAAGTAPRIDGLASSWADRNPNLMPSMIAQFERDGTTIKDVLDFFKVRFDLKGKALNGEWITETEGQQPVEVFLAFANAPEGAISLPSHYRLARKRFETTERTA